MPDPALLDRLAEIIKRASYLYPAGSDIDEGCRGIAAALLASEEWLTREGVVRAAKAEHAHCDGVGVDLDNDAATPCFVCGALGRFMAVRGTT